MKMELECELKVTKQELDIIGNTLVNTEFPIEKRMRALFTLKNITGDVALDHMLKCLSDESVLLKHEVLYCIGQIKDSKAIPALKGVLQNPCEHVVARHEAAEALGAIGDQSVREILKEFQFDPEVEVAETCQIALDRLEWLSAGGKDELHLFNSVDPAPPYEDIASLDILKEIYLNKDKSLFDRYKAMFSLRNVNNSSSIKYLCEGLKDESALFRHEVAFVLGQMKASDAEAFLTDVLENENEHEMVRHESAESLGSIATDSVERTLERFKNHPNRLISESCLVALDILKDEKSNTFQYANALDSVRSQTKVC